MLCQVCRAFSLPAHVVREDGRPCTCGGRVWAPEPACKHADPRVMRGGSVGPPSGKWCAACGATLVRGPGGGGGWRLPAHPPRALAACAHPRRAGQRWCPDCGAWWSGEGRNPTLGDDGQPVPETPMDELRRTSMRARGGVWDWEGNAGKPWGRFYASAGEAREAADAERARLQGALTAPVVARDEAAERGERTTCTYCAAPATERCAYLVCLPDRMTCGAPLCAAHAKHPWRNSQPYCRDHAEKIAQKAEEHRR